MPLIEKGELEQARERRVEALRQTFQGPGLESHATTHSFKMLADAFGYSDKLEDFNEMLDEVFDGMPENLFTLAFVNALVYEKGENLTARREAFLAKHDMSGRTLMRYEVEGANLFVRQFEMLEEVMQRAKELEESEDAARDLDIAALRRRASDLSAENEKLEKSLSALTDEFREIQKQLAEAQERITEHDVFSSMLAGRMDNILRALKYRANVEVDESDDLAPLQAGAWNHITWRAKEANEATPST